MNKESIYEIRSILDFMEEYGALVSKAQETGDTERENDLCAAESNARYRLRKLVDQLLGDVQDRVANTD